MVPIPGLSTSLTKETYIILVAWVALGVNFYAPTVMCSDTTLRGSPARRARLAPDGTEQRQRTKERGPPESGPRCMTSYVRGVVRA